ncbi:hypothetical protein ACSBR1_014523 [Camellia fascicularis]
MVVFSQLFLRYAAEDGHNDRCGLRLEYLHHGYSVPVAHCELKPSNVLLDDDMVAHVSNFGIAKLLGVGESIAQTRTIATFGYIAPEYGLEGLVSTKCDVYNYGIMLMETFTRSKPIDARFDGDLSLTCSVANVVPNAIVQVLDANLLRQDIEHNNARVQCVPSLMQLALNCWADSSEEGMIMKDVLVAIKKITLRWFWVGGSIWTWRRFERDSARRIDQFEVLGLG